MRKRLYKGPTGYDEAYIVLKNGDIYIEYETIRDGGIGGPFTETTIIPLDNAAIKSLKSFLKKNV